MRCQFEISVAKESFKFNAAHFVAFKGYRERLHGHNYLVSIRLIGSRKIGRDGYVLDYGCVKKVAKNVCKELNEHFICPMLSDVIKIETVVEGINGKAKDHLKLTCEDGTIFVFPRDDCAMLPIVHATTEELAIYLWRKIIVDLDCVLLKSRGINTMEITVAEAPGQEATFRLEIPEIMKEDDPMFDIMTYITAGDIPVEGCASQLLPPDESATNSLKCQIDSQATNNSSSKKCCEDCVNSLSKKLEKLALAIDDGKFADKTDSKKDLSSTLDELKAIMN